jgi:phage-related minor tail protein
MIYTIKLKFEADRELTAAEIEALLGSIELQVQEPQDLEGEDAEYGTVVQETTIEGEGK